MAHERRALSEGLTRDQDQRESDGSGGAFRLGGKIGEAFRAGIDLLLSRPEK